MAKKMQKLFAMLLIGTVTLSATSLSALALDVDVALGDVTISSVTDESGSTTVSHTAAKENGTTEERTDKLGENESVYVTQSGEAPTGNTITVESGVQGVDLVLKNVNIQAEKGESAVAIGTDASANITVSGENTLVGGTNGAGIAVSGDATLNLSGDGDGGTLTAIGNGGKDEKGTSGAGIGGTKENGTSGTINIDSLHGLTAEGYGEHAAGIGSAFKGSSGAITITDSTIDEVAGGFVTSQLNDPPYGNKDPEGGAAIGGGGKAGTCGDITIDNTTISAAYGGSKATAIGGSCWADVGNITITDSVLTKVVGGATSAGIGVGRVSTSNGGDSAYEANANITIKDSTVVVTGGEYGAAIGTGYNGDSIGNKLATDGRQNKVLAPTTINIENSNVTAIGGNGGAGIGGGYKGWNTNVTITGGTVYAQSGVLDNKNVRTENGASAIGTGANGTGQFEGGKITIDDTAQVIAVSNGGKWAIDLSCDVTGVAPAYQNMFLSLGSETTCSGKQSKNEVDNCKTVDYKNGYTVIMNGYTIVLPADFLCAAVTTGGAEGEFRTINEDGTWYFSHYGSVASAPKNYASAATAEALGAVVLDMTVTGDLAANSYLHVALRPNSEVPPPVPTPGPGPGTDPGTDPDPDPGTDPDEDTPTIDIPDGDAPLTDIPTTDIPTTDIPDEDEPLTDIPTTDIPDEDVPLSDIPKTGDISALWLALAALSGTGLAGVSLLGRKKQDEE